VIVAHSAADCDSGGFLDSETTAGTELSRGTAAIGVRPRTMRARRHAWRRSHANGGPQPAIVTIDHPAAHDTDVKTMTEAEHSHLFAIARDSLLREFPAALAFYVYGSFARGDEWSDSDLDLAVLLPAEHRIDDALGVTQRVSASVGRAVDLADLRRAGDVLRGEVLAGGKTLFESNPEAVLAWEASAMSRYARHREEIRDILSQFERTGIGYLP
jgi:predicted nucleotidyltransferase